MSATRTISVRRVPGLLLSGALVTTLTFGLAACGQRPGAAAVVDGQRISVTEVQEATTSLRATYPAAFGKFTNADVLGFLIIAPSAERAASAAGTGVSDDMVRQTIISSAQQNGSSAVHIDKLNAQALHALRGLLAANQLTGTAATQFRTTIAALPVEVSPRFGTFNRTNASVAAPAPNWLPKPKPTATASPSATG